MFERHSAPVIAEHEARLAVFDLGQNVDQACEGIP